MERECVRLHTSTQVVRACATQDPLLKAAQRHLDLSYDNVVL